MSPISARAIASGRRCASPRLSPDGSTVVVIVSDLDGTRLVAVSVDGGPEVTVPLELVPSTSPGSLAWRPAGDALVVVTGDGALIEVDVASGASTSLATEADGPWSAPQPAPEGARVVAVRDERDVVVIGGGTQVVLSEGNDFACDPVWSPDGLRVCWHEWSVPDMPWDSSRIVMAPADGAGPRRIVAGGSGTAVGEPRFSPDRRHLAFLSDAGGSFQVWMADGGGNDARALMDEAEEHAPPTWGSGNRSFVWSPDGATIVFTRNRDGFGSTVVRDVEQGRARTLTGGADRPWTEQLTELDWRGPTILVTRSGPVTPDRIETWPAEALERGLRADQAFTTQIGDMARRAAADAGRNPEEMASELVDKMNRSGMVGLVMPEARPVLVTAEPDFEPSVAVPVVERWASTGGVSVTGRCYQPDAESVPTPPPMLVWTHGGPTDQWRASFRGRISYFVERGWAVLVPDHRGSTGHGRQWTQALRGQWGELDVADVAAGVAAAGERGWADPDRIVTIGASAGGFTSLLVAARYPRLVAAVVATAPVTDLVAMRGGDHRFEAHYHDSLIGPLPGAAAVEAARSPMAFVDSITCPVLVLHGADDRVVPVEHSRRFVESLQAVAPNPDAVELVVYDGEGHGIGQPDHVADSLERIEAFLRRHVLGEERS